MPDRSVEENRGIGLREEGFDSRCDQTSCAKERKDKWRALTGEGRRRDHRRYPVLEARMTDAWGEATVDVGLDL